MEIDLSNRYVNALTERMRGRFDKELIRFAIILSTTISLLLIIWGIVEIFFSKLYVQSFYYYVFSIPAYCIVTVLGFFLINIFFIPQILQVALEIFVPSTLIFGVCLLYYYVPYRHFFAFETLGIGTFCLVYSAIGFLNYKILNAKLNEVDSRSIRSAVNAEAVSGSSGLSGLGISSLLFGFLVLTATFLISSYKFPSLEHWLNSHRWLSNGAMLVYYVSPGLSVIAILLGFIGLFRKNSEKFTSPVGILFGIVSVLFWLQHPPIVA